MNEHLWEKFVFNNNQKIYQLKMIHINSNIIFRVDDTISSPKRIYKDNYSINDLRKFDSFFYSFETIKNLYLYLLDLCKGNNFTLTEKEDQIILSFQPNKLINEIKIPLNISDPYFDTFFNVLYDEYRKLKEEIGSLKIENLRLKIQSCSTPKEDKYIIKKSNEISFEIKSKSKEQNDYNDNDFRILKSKSDIENDSLNNSNIDLENDNLSDNKNYVINSNDEKFFNELFKKISEDEKNNYCSIFLNKINQYKQEIEFSSFILSMVKNMKNDDKYISANIDLLKYLSYNLPIIVKSKNKKGCPIIICINSLFWFDKWINYSFDNIKDYKNCFIGVAKFIGELAKNLLLFRNKFPFILKRILKNIENETNKEQYETLIIVFIIICKSFIVSHNKYDNINHLKEFNESKQKINENIENFLKIEKVQNADFTIQCDIKNLLVLKNNFFEVLENNNLNKLNSNNNISNNQNNDETQNVNDGCLPKQSSLNNYNFSAYFNPIKLQDNPLNISKTCVIPQNINNNIVLNNNNNNQMNDQINSQSFNSESYNNNNNNQINNNNINSNNQVNNNQINNNEQINNNKLVNNQKNDNNYITIIRSHKNKKTKKNKEEILNESILDDLKYYISFLDKGGKVEDYDWKIITNLYNNKGYEISEIFNSYINASLSVVKNKTILSYVNTYMTEIISYYSTIVDEKQKNNVKKSVHTCLNSISSLYDSNIYIIDILANSIFGFVRYEYIKYDDIQVVYSKFKDYEKYFIILKKIYLIDGETSTLKYFRKFDFVRKNQHIFEKVINNNSIF